MAQYSRQLNMDTAEERSLSPTCEVLNDEAARTMFVSPSLKYRMRSTSLWRGRSGLEKVLLVCLSFLLLLCCTFIVVLVVIKKVTSPPDYYVLHCLLPAGNQHEHQLPPPGPTPAVQQVPVTPGLSRNLSEPRLCGGGGRDHPVGRLHGGSLSGLLPVRLWRLDQIKPHPGRKVQLEHFQETLAE